MAQNVNENVQKKNLKMREEQEQRAKLFVEKKKKAFAEAQKIVESLLEESASEADFTEKAKYIEPSHYDDIVEERSIEKLCGYPLCPNQLKQVVNQKFYVSSKQNRVYDITERKASRFLRDQVSDEPLEKRNADFSITFKFLSQSSDRGQPGDVVVQHPSAGLKKQLDELGINSSFKPTTATNPEKQTENTSISSGKSVCDDDKSENEASNSEISEPTFNVAGETDEEKYKNLMALIDKRDALLAGMSNKKTGSRTDDSEVKDIEIKTEIDETDKGVTRGDSAEQFQQVDNSENKSHSDSDKLIPEVSVRTEKTEKTDTQTFYPNAFDSRKLGMNYSDVFSNIERAKTTSSVNDNSRNDKCSVRPKNMPLLVVGRTLNQWKTAASVYYITNKTDQRDKVEDDLPDTDLEKMFATSLNIAGCPTVPAEKVPDLNQLVKDAENSVLRVREFYCSETIDSDDDADEDEDKVDENTLEYQREPVVPPIDSTSQNSIRRKLVLNSIDRCLTKILPSLNMLSRDVSTQLQQLVSTFHLSKDNVTMRPAEWNLLTFVLLKLLASKDKNIAMNLETDQAKKFSAGVLRSFQLSQTDVDILIQRMTASYD